MKILVKSGDAEILFEHENESNSNPASITKDYSNTANNETLLSTIKFIVDELIKIREAEK